MSLLFVPSFPFHFFGRKSWYRKCRTVNHITNNIIYIQPFIYYIIWCYSFHFWPYLVYRCFYFVFGWLLIQMNSSDYFSWVFHIKFHWFLSFCLGYPLVNRGLPLVMRWYRQNKTQKEIAVKYVLLPYLLKKLQRHYTCVSSEFCRDSQRNSID